MCFEGRDSLVPPSLKWPVMLCVGLVWHTSDSGLLAPSVGLRLRGKQRLNAPSVMGPEASEFGFVGSRACDYPTGDRFSRDSLLESAARWYVGGL